jgi:hypothetical protein
LLKNEGANNIAMRFPVMVSSKCLIMMKQENPLLTHIACWLGVGILCLSVHAQKLPSIQLEGMRAPLETKTDGKATEWGDQLRAYNRSTETYYTIANSDDKLYLTIQAKDPAIIKKILVGGITFTVNHSGKKNDPENAAVTFPVLTNADGAAIAMQLSEQPTAKNTEGKDKQMDSLVRLMNANMSNKIKDIKLKGIKLIADSVISVYNEDDIKAIALFDQHKTFTYELSLPLKYLGLSFKGPLKFNYNVMLNGLDKANMHEVAPNSRGIVRVVNVSNSFASARSMDNMVYPTDFWGEYTLVK